MIFQKSKYYGQFLPFPLLGNLVQQIRLWSLGHNKGAWSSPPVFVSPSPVSWRVPNWWNHSPK
jgi:hypothetical protein